MNRLYLTILFASFISPVCSQQIKFIRVDAGTAFLAASPPENDNIRAVVDNYGYSEDEYDDASTDLRALYVLVHAGVKAEIFSPNNKWSLTTGLSYLRAEGDFQTKGLFFARPFFFLKFREQGTTTEYLTISRIGQKSSFIGVPVEVTFYPFTPRRFNLFFKGGGSVNLNVSNSSDVVFHEPSMEKYEDQVMEQFDTPDRVSGIFFLAPGFHFSVKQVKFGMEASFPTVFINSHGGGLVHPRVGGGLNVFFSFPLTPVSNE
jgi:hypothetical protein